MNRVKVEGLPFWAVGDMVVSGIGSDGWSFSLRKTSGEYLGEMTAEAVGEMLKRGELMLPNRGRGIAFQR